VKESLDPGRRIIEATPLEFVEMCQEYRLPPDVTEAVKVNLLEGAALPKRREDCIIKLRDIATSPAWRDMDRQLKQRAASLKKNSTRTSVLSIAPLTTTCPSRNFERCMMRS